MQKADGFKARKAATKLKVLQLYRLGHTQIEITSAMPKEPPSNIYRWIAQAVAKDSKIESEHQMSEKGREVGAVVKVDQTRDRVTLFLDDATIVEHQMALGVSFAMGTPAQVDRELFRQQVTNGGYVEPDFNLPLLMKLRLVDGLSLRKTKKKYFWVTKRKISVYMIRKLLTNMEVVWEDEEGQKALYRELKAQAKFEEDRRKLAQHIKNEVTSQRPSPFPRILLEGPIAKAIEASKNGPTEWVPLGSVPKSADDN